MSQDWRQPLPNVTRALILVHGRLRNAQTYLQSGIDAAEHAGVSANTLVIAPQFLNASDIKRNHLDGQVLRWNGNDRMAGEPSTGPGANQLPDGALDQIIKHLGNCTLFPALKEIVVAGHSGGGQVVQRFALTGHDHPTLKNEGIRLRYVVAEPVVLCLLQPTATGAVRYRRVAQASTIGSTACNTCRPTPKAKAPSSWSRPTCHGTSPTCLGQQDTDPNHPALDKSCEAETQGAYRLMRGHNYFDYLKHRHPQLSQTLVEVPGGGA